MQKSAIPILCAKFNDKGEMISRITLGTGFFINRKGDFLTAAHVVTSLLELRRQENPCDGIIYAAKADWNTRYGNAKIGLRFFALENCAYRLKDDVGVCWLKKNPFLDPDVNKFIQPAALASYTKYSDGSAIAFTGFPLQFVFPITSKGYVASYDPSTQKLIIDKTTWPGASGSPLYASDGKVIGIVIEQGIDKSAGSLGRGLLTWLWTCCANKRFPLKSETAIENSTKRAATIAIIIVHSENLRNSN
jgi:V8-like Glu-specific endopeptidase